MQTNSTLRKRSFHLYWKNREVLWPAFLLFALTSVVWFVIQTYLIQGNLLKDTLNFVYQLALTPITLGLYHMLLHLVRGGEISLPMLFTFVRRPQRLRKLCAACLFIQLPVLIISLLTLSLDIVDREIIQTDQATALSGGIVAAGLVITWLSLRLFLFPYLFLSDPKETIITLVKSSFQTMKGRVRRLIWFGITVYWWSILLLAAFMALSSALFSPMNLLKAENAATPERLLYQLGLSLVMALLNPYLYLALAGFANEQMKSAQSLKKQSEKA